MRRIKILIYFVFIPLVVVGGCTTAIVMRMKGKPEPPRTAKVERGDIVIAVRETGVVAPIKQVEVKSKVAGQLAVLAVEEGDRVAQGQLVARLKVPELEAQRDQMNAQLDGAQSRVEQAQLTYHRDVELIETQVKQAQSSLRAARGAAQESDTRRRDAVRVYENKKRLLEMGGYVSQNDVDAAKAAADIAAQAQQSAEERVKEQDLAVQAAETRRSEVAMSQARVTEAQAALRQVRDSLAEIESRLQDATITAPCSGVVISRQVREGELMTAVSYYGSGAPIVIIGDLSTMLVKVALNEVDVDKLHLGQQVKITADALREKHFTGRITRISPAGAASQTGQAIVKFPIEITVTGNTAGLKPGMTANVEITCQQVNRVLCVPNDALFEKKGKWYVSIYSGMKNGKPQCQDREVKKGLANDARTEIRSGVKDGETIELGKSGIPERKKIDINSGHGEGEEE